MHLEANIRQALKKIGVNKREKILVALSGGKDSAVIAYIMKKNGYNIEGFHINLGMGEYNKKCLDAVEKLCRDMDIKLHVYDIKKETGKKMPDYFRENSFRKISNCTICGTFKKWIMNREARRLKADKIATGHHRDDELQTFLMNIFKGSPNLNSNFGPVLNVKDEKFVVKIKPLFFAPEKEIEKYAKKSGLPSVKETCPYRKETYRIEIRKLFEKLSEKERQNIMKNFLEISGRIRKETSKVSYCEICGEPARNKICKKCELMNVKKK